VAIVYGGSGDWYWREAPDASSIPLVFFNALNQSFFMGFFFLLAGYFTPQSLEKKGLGPFLTDRLKRLGIPLLSYFSSYRRSPALSSECTRMMLRERPSKLSIIGPISNRIPCGFAWP
tara:strand:- start:486 stop:839 length:354 start_codon:yes stop_codon:yes gene_type:complete